MLLKAVVVSQHGLKHAFAVRILESADSAFVNEILLFFKTSYDRCTSKQNQAVERKF